MKRDPAPTARSAIKSSLISHQTDETRPYRVHSHERAPYNQASRKRSDLIRFDENAIARMCAARDFSTRSLFVTKIIPDDKKFLPQLAGKRSTFHSSHASRPSPLHVGRLPGNDVVFLDPLPIQIHQPVTGKTRSFRLHLGQVLFRNIEKFAATSKPRKTCFT